MNVLSPIQSGLSGVTRGLENIQETANDIASTGTIKQEGNNTTIDLTQSLADLEEQKLATLAATKAVAAAEDVLGTLLDVSV